MGWQSWWKHKHRGTTPTFFELSLTRCLRQYSLSLPEALVLCISIAFSTQIHNIFCMSSNQHQVPIFRWIRFFKEGLLITFHLDVYDVLYCQKTGSIRSTRCWLWSCTRYTLRQPFPKFPWQLLLSKCWGPCDIRRKPPRTDRSFGEKEVFTFLKNPSLKTGSITSWQGDSGQGKLQNLSRLG
jgi:hypothetical protein